jgi:hypothetical protein
VQGFLHLVSISYKSNKADKEMDNETIDDSYNGYREF